MDGALPTAALDVAGLDIAMEERETLTPESLITMTNFAGSREGNGVWAGESSSWGGRLSDEERVWRGGRGRGRWVRARAGS